MEARYYALVVLGIVFIGFSLFLKRISTPRTDLLPAIGTIIEEYSSASDLWDAGRSYGYNIEFTSERGVEVGSSVEYRIIDLDYDIGDTVHIFYRYTPKGDPIVYINEEGFERAAGGEKGGIMISMALGIACFVAFGILLIKSMF